MCPNEHTQHIVGDELHKLTYKVSLCFSLNAPEAWRGLSGLIWLELTQTWGGITFWVNIFIFVVTSCLDLWFSSEQQSTLDIL